MPIHIRQLPTLGRVGNLSRMSSTTILLVPIAIVALSLCCLIGFLLGLSRFDGRLKNQVNRLNKQLAEEAAERARAPTICRHTVLLDGVSHGGKTTFLARLACPTADEAQLANIALTRRQQLTKEIPLCWERTASDGHPPILHALQFFDVAGEQPATVINAMLDLAAKTSEDQRIVALWVWDLANLSGSHARMTREVINMAYGSDVARSLIRKIVIFFNKIDTLDPAAAKETIEQEKKHIRDVVDRALGAGYEIHFHAGSATDGRGMFEAYGALLRALELGKNYHSVHVSEPEPMARAGR